MQNTPTAPRRVETNMIFGEQLESLIWLEEKLIIYQGVRTKLTPMIDQYLDSKKQNPDAILLFRMGDFYEAFFDDAKTISRALDLTLTSRNKSDDGNDLPMAGVPVRSLNEHLFSLVEQGFRVAICEQLEDPALAQGLVKRGVTQIITPGTLCDDRPGYDKSARFLSAIVWEDSEETSKTKSKTSGPQTKDFRRSALASIDLSTGYCTMTELSNLQNLQAELQRINAREIVSHRLPDDDSIFASLGHEMPFQLRDRALFQASTLLERWKLSEDTNHSRLSRDKFLSFLGAIENAGFKTPELVSDAFGGLLGYLLELHYPLTANIEQIYPYRCEAFMNIDAATFQNLEIYASLRGGQRKGSLLDELDDTVTSAGARLLQNWLAYPLIERPQIERRQEAVQCLFDGSTEREDLRLKLKDTADLERLATKLANDRIVPRELVLLKNTLSIVPSLAELCMTLNAPYLKEAAAQLNPLKVLKDEIDAALVDEAPSNLNDSDFFKPGYDAELDKLKDLSQNGHDWLLNYEANERQRTGINSLKTGYQRVFGYFLEVTKANLSLVPSNYIRSQTLSNSERFYTTELKEYEESHLNAKADQAKRELELYAALKAKACEAIPSLIKNARILAQIDLLASLAHTAHHRQYTRPQMLDGLEFSLKEARHPVVERFLPKGERFVPNDIRLDKNGRLMIITGPNMAGKSTIIRQAAIITLMAQMGSFVPVESATIGIVDRIFSRVGASDNLALGQSTFMVEMTETANILQNATVKSLIILDEIGRGTSTYDGLSLAWAIAEHLHNHIGARTLFATHYHELTELSNVLDGVKNSSVTVKEYKKDIIFLRKLVDGAANRSYGIQVARLAGVPVPVIERAEGILETLERHAHRDLGRVPESAQAEDVLLRATRAQGLLFGQQETNNTVVVDPKSLELIEELRHLPIDAITPISALNWLYKWQKKLKQ